MNYRSQFILSLFMAALFSTPSLLAGSKIAAPTKEEYIKAKSVVVKSKGIFLEKKGKKIPVKALYTDKNGKLVAVTEIMTFRNRQVAKGLCLDSKTKDQRHGWYIDWSSPKEKGEPNCPKCRKKYREGKRERNDRAGKDNPNKRDHSNKNR